jgi:hypothetical protein
MAVHARISIAREGSHPRARLLGMVGIDLASLAAVVALAAGGACVWLLTRTEAGRLDVSTADGMTALAIVMAALPAWSALQVGLLLGRGGTLGGLAAHAERAALPASPGRCALWLALHPIAAPTWLWTAAALALPAWEIASLAVLGVTLAIALLAAASLVIALAKPESRPLHSRLAGVRRA